MTPPGPASLHIVKTGSGWINVAFTDTIVDVGSKIALKAAPDSDMQLVNLNDFLGKQNVVLYFYPKDDTPGCTIEALEFTELEDEFAALPIPEAECAHARRALDDIVRRVAERVPPFDAIPVPPR